LAACSGIWPFALFLGLDVVGNGSTVVKDRKTGLFDCRFVDENLLATLDRLDEAIAAVEELHGLLLRHGDILEAMRAVTWVLGERGKCSIKSPTLASRIHSPASHSIV
jgi:hypothetical protein